MGAGKAADRPAETPLLSRIRESVIGDDQVMVGPFGPRRVQVIEQRGLGVELLTQPDQVVERQRLQPPGAQVAGKAHAFHVQDDFIEEKQHRATGPIKARAGFQAGARRRLSGDQPRSTGSVRKWRPWRSSISTTQMSGSMRTARSSS